MTSAGRALRRADGLVTWRATVEMFRKRSRLCLATAPAAEVLGDDGDAPAVTPRRSLSLSFGAQEGGGSLHGASLSAWAHQAAAGGDAPDPGAGWTQQLCTQRDDGGDTTRWAASQGGGAGTCDDLDWAPSQPALHPGAGGGGAFFSPRGQAEEGWPGEAVMESPLPGGEPGAESEEGQATGANAWTRFASALAAAGNGPADGDGGTLSRGDSGRGHALASGGGLEVDWGQGTTQHQDAPASFLYAACQPRHPGGMRRDDTAAALGGHREGGGGHSRPGCWAEGGGHNRSPPPASSDDDLSAGQLELQLQVRGKARCPPQGSRGRGRYAGGASPLRLLNCQLGGEGPGRGKVMPGPRAAPVPTHLALTDDAVPWSQEQFWAGAFPTASQGERTHYAAAAPPQPPPYAPPPPPMSLDTWVDDVTRTPPPPIILPEFSAQLVAAAGHQGYDAFSPGEARCSQYIHSPAPLSLHQYGGEGVGQEQVGAGLQPLHAPANQDSSPSDLCAQPPQQAHGAGEQGEKLALPLRPALFPIFLVRPPMQRGQRSCSTLTRSHLSFQKKGSRKVHLVRHGESEYNAACGRPGSSWDDPQIFDAPLTEQGRNQAEALGSTLAGLLGRRCVWVTSPLTRALQTCVLARQAVGAACPDTWAMPTRETPWVSVRPELSEHLVTCGDVGRPRRALCEAFPDLAAGGAFGQLADVWWFSPPGKPNCCTLRCVSVSETREQLRARVGAFRKWVLTQPGEELVVFGHSTFFKYFMQGEGMEGNRLKNGEVMTLTL